jgi:hypothetical protein
MRHCGCSLSIARSRTADGRCDDHSAKQADQSSQGMWLWVWVAILYSTEQTGTLSRSNPAPEHAVKRHRVTLQTGS